MSMFFGGGGGACRIIVNGAGDWEVTPPGGQITQIGDAGGTSHGLVTNDDLFISNRLEVDGDAYFDGDTSFAGDMGLSSFGELTFYGQNNIWIDHGQSGSILTHLKANELLTIPVGQGAAGVNTAVNLAPADSIIIAVAVYVKQAPGGGATTFNVGRTGGNIDEFIQAMSTALGTNGNSAADGDGVNTGPVHNAATNTFVITTDANVTGTDMRLRIVVWYNTITEPTA